MSRGNDFDSFCANQNLVIEANVYTFSKGGQVSGADGSNERNDATAGLPSYAASAQSLKVIEMIYDDYHRRIHRPT